MLKISRRWRELLLAAGAYLVLSLVIWSHLWFSGRPKTICGCGDAATYLWLLQWQAHAIAHGLDPFYSSALNHPTGVNLMANASGVVLAPITWIFGAVASLNVILTLSPVASAVAMFVLLRRWVSWSPAAFIGGLFYGFSPFVLESLSETHANLGFAFLPPLVVICLDELLFRRRRRPIRTGVVLGVLLTLQFFIGNEELLIMGIVVAVTLLFVLVHAAAQHRESLRDHARFAAKGLLTTGVTAGVLLAYPAWFVFDGPAHFSGPVWLASSAYSGASAKDFLLPNQNVILPGVSHSFNVLQGGYQGFVISPQYFGFGVLAVLLGGLVAYRRDLRLRIFGAAAVVSVVLSLGASTSVPLPWNVVAHLPVFEDVLPYRFVLMTYLAVAIMLALILDHAHSSFAHSHSSFKVPTWAAAASGAVLAALAIGPPAVYAARSLPFTAKHVFVPEWFRDVGDHLAHHQVLLVVPAPFTAESAVAWQSYDQIDYSMVGESGPGALLARAGKERAGQTVIESAAEFPVSNHPPNENSTTFAFLREALSGWDVTTVVVPDQGAHIPIYDQIRSVTLVAALITATTGERPLHQASAWVWTHVNDDPGKVRLTSAGFAACTSGLVPNGAAAVDAATACVLSSEAR